MHHVCIDISLINITVVTTSCMHVILSSFHERNKQTNKQTRIYNSYDIGTRHYFYWDIHSELIRGQIKKPCKKAVRFISNRSSFPRIFLSYI